MESDAERGVGSSENDERTSSSLTIKGLNAGMDSIVAKAGTLPTLGSVATLVDFERRFKRALDATPFGCYPAMLLDVYEGTVGWSETDIDFVEKGWRHVQAQMSSTRTSSSLLLALSGNPNELYKAQTRAAGNSKARLAEGDRVTHVKTHKSPSWKQPLNPT